MFAMVSLDLREVLPLAIHELALVSWGALQIQDRSPQSTNWRPVVSCNGMFPQERSATANQFLTLVVCVHKLSRPWESPGKWFWSYKVLEILVKGHGNSLNFVGYDVGGGHNDAGADVKICEN